MSKPNPCERKLFSLINAQEWHLDRLYAEYTREFGTIFRGYNGRMTDARKRAFDNALIRFNDDLERLVQEQIETSFSLSNACSDDFIKDYIKDMGVPGEQVETMLANNAGAAKSFIKRKVGGSFLSDRVVSVTKGTREAVNLLLESGIVNGRSASEMATDLKKYLKEPERRFRRLRNEEGKLVLSQPAKNYNPGQGVYRSSYKNALRISRNEVNIAYRTNDFERRKTMPFVMGQRIELSAAHVVRDICDFLVGSYSKDFKFVGFHPMCKCVSNSIVLPREKFKSYLSGGNIDQRHLVKGIPAKAQKYLNKNSEQIKGWQNKPYFIRDNFKPSKSGFDLNI
ncbi:hypothetical protein [Leeuwenhoekiella marinoflava]|uniref:Uncharacterized protein n=2 Tax=Leeuwenhoekiella marinoflava TaxID=988 RepID=A0A4Q0PMS1_9FLAO|nr:hypothetical protein [Leeuwenhoekiella marinoflava]RXG31800.1 hypothetical protein DSL99_1624 [Leeuwenhoekiella marinoflava]SHF04716.1 hypothetical protein SAMN02745246_01558 [Leeuwenhoekiella marinoflava DSM 3653]